MKQNKSALITGASRGIGRAVALELASRGYDIIINFLTNKKLAEDLCQYIKSNFKVRAITLCANVGVESDVKEMIDEAVKEFGRIDVLVNNAGIQSLEPFADKTVDKIEKTFNVNFIGPYLVTKYTAPIMLKNKYGKIINISSNDVYKGCSSDIFDYDASKASLSIFTRAMAEEFAPFINVNTISPGWIKTDMLNDLPKEFLESEAQHIYKRRIGTPEDVAKLAAFLVSDDAEYIDGENIIIDGGME